MLTGSLMLQLINKTFGMSIMIILMSSAPAVVRAQSQEKVYSQMIINLSRGIVWPGLAISENFVIGVLEYEPLATELSGAAISLKVGSRKIEIKKLSALDVSNCNVLFIPAYKAKALTGLLTRLGDSPTLIITNKSGLATKGSGVNFLLLNGKLKYEINCRSIEKRGLKISAGIKGMGIVVN
jgi:hypothetical protein